MEMVFGKGGVTQFLGRNGFYRCKGFEFRRIKTDEPEWDPDVVRVYPVTTKGRPGRCFIEIPVTEIREFTRTLSRASKRE